MRAVLFGIAVRCLLACVALLPIAAMAQPAAASGDHLRVALVTAAPGSLYWERFGHNAILIEDSAVGSSRMYNFGWFDFEQKNFMLNFARGRMLYRLAVTDPEHDIASYAQENRSVWLQELALDPAQKLALQQALEHNALPENAEYRYDYYLDNCSTRVRDALDAAIGGGIRRTALGRGRGETFRSLSLAYAQEIPWLAFGIHLGLGPTADRRINFWEEAFLPLRLRDLVKEIELRNADGTLRPLVSGERTLYEGKLSDQIAEQPNWFWPMLLIGVIFAAVLGFGLRSKHPRFRSFAAAIGAIGSLIFGIIGVVLAALWIGTDHQIAWRNANLWLFSPLCLLLIVPIWRLRRVEASASMTTQIVCWLVFGIAVASLLASLLKLNTQAQSDWMVLLLPWHLAIWQRLQSLPTQK